MSAEDAKRFIKRLKTDKAMPADMKIAAIESAGFHFTRHSADLFSVIVFIEGRTEKIDDIL
jgi:hypothetical protein